MKALSGLVPLAIGIAVIGGLTWFMLDRNVGLGKWLLAGLLFAHGWVHVMFVFPQPETSTAAAGGPEWPFEMGRSWLVTGLGLDVGLVRAVGVAVIAIVVVSFALAALSTLGFLVPAEWWPGLVIGAAIGSTALLALFFSKMLLLGFAIDLALLWFVLASGWRPAAGPLGGP